MTVPSDAELRIRMLAATVRRLAQELSAGRPVVDELDAAAAELAAELDRYNLVGELRLDEEYPREAASISS